MNSISEQIQELLKAIEQQPHETSLLQTLADCYMQTGVPQQAIEYYAKAAAIDPSLFLANQLNDWGNLALENHKYDQAIAYFTQVTLLEPDDYIGYHGLGLVHIDKQEYNQAIILFNKIISVHFQNGMRPGQPPGFLANWYYLLGYSYCYNTQYEQAVNALSTAVNYSPTFESAKKLLKLAESMIK